MKKTLAHLALALAVTCAAQAAEPLGWVDGVTNGVVHGWAVDPDTPAANVTVHVYVDGVAGRGVLAGSALADAPRADVTALGYPGNHGFRFQLPGRFRDGRPHQVHVYAIDTSGQPPNPQLSGSPMGFNLGGAAPTPTGPSARGLSWVRSNPMFVSGLTVSMPGPTQTEADDYFDRFGANAVHLWADGLPGSMLGWRRARPNARWLAWVHSNGISQGTGQFLGGVARDHPGRIGYQIGDEPRTLAELDEILRTVPAVRAHDPTALIVLNFTYHAPEIDRQLELSGRHPDVDVLSYDHYSRDSSGVYAELERFRAAGLRHNKPYWRYLYSYVDRNGLPTESDMRWNAFSGLVYGYTGHTWFLYQIGQQHGQQAGLTPALFAQRGSFAAAKTALYPIASQINVELRNLGRAITQLTSTDVCYEIGRFSFIRRWHVPGTHGWRRGAGGDPYLARVNKNGRDLSLGFFTDAQGEHYVMLQNVSRTHGRQTAKGSRARTFALEFDFAQAPQGVDRGSLQVLDKATGQVVSQPLQRLGADRSRFEVTLAAGDPVLFKYATGAPFARGR